MDAVCGVRLSPAFLGTERSILKDYFTSVNLFLDLLFRQTAWKVSFFKVDAFKRENMWIYRTLYHL